MQIRHKWACLELFQNDPWHLQNMHQACLFGGLSQIQEKNVQVVEEQ